MAKGRRTPYGKLAGVPADDAEDPAGASIGIPCLDAGGWRLRPLHDDDARFILSALNDPGMLRARSALPPVDEAASGEWIGRATRASADGTYAPWVLLASDNDTPIGLIVLQAVDRTAGTAEVGYFVSTGWREHGAATSALAAVAAWAFGVLGLHRIYLLHDADNTASCRVALRAGFRIEGVLRESRRRRDGSRCDEELHARLSTDPPTRDV
jgi:RimJ/RimL family protein N-acetyltransferase